MFSLMNAIYHEHNWLDYGKVQEYIIVYPPYTWTFSQETECNHYRGEFHKTAYAYDPENAQIQETKSK